MDVGSVYVDFVTEIWYKIVFTAARSLKLIVIKLFYRNESL